MIDVHCHLEQPDFDADREKVIAECAKQMKAIVSSSPYLKHFKKALEMHRKYPKFVFIVLAIHPIYVEETSNEDIEKACSFIRENKNEISAIGETGLDYFHVKDEKLREMQKKMFEKFIDLASELNKPLVVHCRDAFDDCISILEEKGMKNKKVLIHLFSSRKHLAKVIENGWMISVSPNILKSKETKKIIRDCLLERAMLETDAPWFGFGKRQIPLGVKIPLEVTADIKGLSIEEVERQTDLNAEKFFDIK